MPFNIFGAWVHQRRSRGAALLALVISQSLAHAGDPPTAARYQIDQPAQPLAESLRSIASQTGVSVLFTPASVEGRMSRAVSGQLSAAEAISRALEGTGLSADIMGDKSIVVRPAGTATPPSSVSVSSNGKVGVFSNDPPLMVAQATPSGEGQAPAPSPSPSPSADGSPAQQLAPVEVTGSRLKRIEADGPAPVNVYTKADIDQSGQPTLERFLSSLNETSVSTGEGSVGLTQGQGTVQLRGLPLGSTLVLINGRRVQAVGSSSGDFFNLNLIPMAAVERVEIVPVGSSAVYGGDALAGVVNVILKKSIDGFAFDARAGAGRGISDGSFSLATGRRDEDGSFLLLGSFDKSTPLTMGERDFFKDGDYRRFGGVDARTRTCTPGTVSSTTGANLPGLSSTFAGIPQSTSGQPLTAASFAATAGQANLCNSLASGNGMALAFGNEDFALHAAGERRITGAWSVFGEISFVNNRLGAEQGGLQLSSVIVPASNAYNPFGVPVRVTERLGLENGSETLVRNTNFTRALAGVRGDLGAAWELEASLSTTRDDGERHLNNTANVAARTAALGSSDPATALNPFTTGVAASPDVIQSIWTDSLRENHGQRDQGSVFARGSLFELPAGKIDAILGAEAAHDRYRTSTSGSFAHDDGRTTRAVYGEMRAPLWRAAPSAGPAWDLASLTVAGRRDRYSDFGSANTYQAGLELRPTRTLLLRASAASSFKPPTLLETDVAEQTYATEDLGLVDPTRGGAPIIGGEVLRTTNPNLKPEKGRAFSVGAVWEPASALGTRFAVSAWRVKINGLISILWPQDAINHPDLFPGFVTRAPSTDGTPGDLTRVLYSEVNFGSVETAGADLEAATSFRAAGAKWTVGASATHTTKYGVAIAPDAPVDDRLGRRAEDYWSPKWKGRLSAGVDGGGWSLGLTSRYLGAYRDIAPSERELGNYWVHDLAGTVDLQRLGVNLGAFKDASVSLAIVNLANRLPEFVETYPYYDYTQADWRGRYVSLRFSTTW